eukprot:scaffold177_cov334-Pavlova_lutheri.AAC.1
MLPNSTKKWTKPYSRTRTWEWETTMAAMKATTTAMAGKCETKQVAWRGKGRTCRKERIRKGWAAKCSQVGKKVGHESEKKKGEHHRTTDEKRTKGQETDRIKSEGEDTRES